MSQNNVGNVSSDNNNLTESSDSGSRSLSETQTATSISNGSRPSAATSNTTSHQQRVANTGGVRHASRDDTRADRLLRLVLAILRGGNLESTTSLVEVIRSSRRDGTDQVDLRAIAERALELCRNDPAIQEELDTVELLLQEFHDDTIQVHLQT